MLDGFSLCFIGSWGREMREPIDSFVVVHLIIKRPADVLISCL